MKNIRKSAITLVLSVGLSIALFSCGSASDIPSDLKIVGGTLVSDSSKDPARVSTVALTNDSGFARGKSFCTSVLIEKDILLTAAHCVTEENGSTTTAKMLAVFSTVVGTSKDDVRNVEKIVANPDYQYKLLEDGIDPEKNPMNDIAVIKLESEAPSTHTPVKLVSSSENYAEHQTIVLAGYGVTETRSIGNTGTLREVKATIENDHTKGNVLIVKGPELGSTAIVTNEDGTTVKQPANGGACAGDSGGPAYFKNGKGWFVAGVTSYGEELPTVEGNRGVRYCVGLEGYVDLRKYHDTILDLVAKVK